jgi:hypothetical protein
MAVQLDIPGGPVPYRLVCADQDLVFHGLFFQRYAFEVDLEDANSLTLTRLRITAGNVDRGFLSLLERYWGQDTPWIATLWQVDLTQPDETPLGAGELFTVMQAGTDLRSAIFDVAAEGVTLSGTMPKRRYTTSSGFPFVPRRIL